MHVDRSIFKTYDIRGIYGEGLTETVAEAIGRAYATYIQPKQVAVGRDVRVSGQSLMEAFIRGVCSMGVDVVDIGVVTSDALYFTVAKYRFDGGAMITASHNPPQWNGIKLTRDQAIPIIKDENQTLADLVEREAFQPVRPGTGQRTSRDIQSEYIQQVVSFSGFGRASRRLKVVIDPGNGTTIRFLPDIMRQLPVDWTWINEQPDGNFPGRNPNPLAEGALDELGRQIVQQSADVGVAFDADADRMFLVDERGRRVSGDVLTALLAKEFLKQHPGSTIVYNLICSRMVPEEITKAGGTPVRSPVGHAFIKPIMRERNAVFGGEISGHFFFRDHYFVDSGLVAMVVALSYLANQPTKLSELAQAIDIYAHEAEVNTKVADIPGTLARLKEKYSDGKLDESDGITIEYPDWWFNARPSNTEPLLRLTVEAKTPDVMQKRREEILAVIRG